MNQRMTRSKIVKYLREFTFLLILGAFVACMLYACASVGSPQGGPIDEAPPRFVTSTPLPNALNYNKQRVEIEFDELVTVEKAMEKVIITPPQMQAPVIKAHGKKIVVEIKDSLQPNTTYTIDFGDAIADNNEKNLLENFSFAFSTGEVVDSMLVAGTLLNAENLEPMPGILVGLHKNLEDTAFTKLPFFRASKTNERGQFWIRNVAPGTYRVYALNDLNRDYKFDQPGEEIAYLDSLVVPSFYPDIMIDTLWKDSLTVDTIIETPYNHFIPDDISLFLFKEKFGRQYLRKSERKADHLLSLTFNSPVDSLPQIRFLNATPSKKDLAVIEYTEGKTVLNYWLKDSLVYKQDTLKTEVTYFKSDSINQLVLSTDTLSLFVKRPKKAPKKNKKEEEKIEFLGLTASASSSMDVFDTLSVRFSEPPELFDPSLIVLQQKIDTVRWDTIPYTVKKNEMNPMIYQLVRRWEYEKEYKLSVDSAAFTSVYGKWNNKLETVFKTKGENDYGHLNFDISGVEGPGFGELLDASDKVVRRSVLKDGRVLFMNLKPAKYYLRYIVDSNGNGIWDTGQYDIKLQPEQVYYYHSFIDVPQNWQIDQSWDVREVPVVRQKPLEITKNKPKEKKRNTSAYGDKTNTQQKPGNQNSRFIPQEP